jgi:hypothetical protein
MWNVIKGGREQLEIELVRALADPNGNAAFDAVLEQLRRRGNLRSNSRDDSAANPAAVGVSEDTTPS